DYRLDHRWFELKDGPCSSGRAGAVDQGNGPPKCLLYSNEHAFDRVGACDVNRERRSLTPRLSYGLDDTGSLALSRLVAHRHRVAAVASQVRNRCSDAAATTGDDENLVGHGRHRLACDRRLGRMGDLGKRVVALFGGLAVPAIPGKRFSQTFPE